MYTNRQSLIGNVALVCLAFIGLEIGTDKGVSARDCCYWKDARL